MTEHPLPDADDPIWSAANGFVVRKDEGTFKFVDGPNERVKVKVTGEQTDGALSLTEVDVLPGFGNNPHAHLVENEAFYIASGAFRLINGCASIEAEAGDFVWIPRGTRHGFKNIGSDVGKLLIYFTPPGFENFFLEAGEDADADGNPPPAWTPDRIEALGDTFRAHRLLLLPKEDDWA